MRKTALALLAALLPLTAAAGDGYESLTITTHGGEQLSVVLSAATTTRFTDSEAVFTETDADGAETLTLSVALTDLRTFTFEPATAPEGVHSISLAGSADAQSAAIYTLEGKRTAASSLDELPRGTYIIRTASASLKVTK